MEFIESPIFTHRLPEYLSDEGYQELQIYLAQDPEAGDMIPGTGGFRKLRWRDRRRGKGKRGGLRVIFYYFPADSQVWLVTLYDKGEMVDLTPAERRILKVTIEEETRQRAAHLRSRRK